MSSKPENESPDRWLCLSNLLVYPVTLTIKKTLVTLGTGDYGRVQPVCPQGGRRPSPVQDRGQCGERGVHQSRRFRRGEEGFLREKV